MKKFFLPVFLFFSLTVPAVHAQDRITQIDSIFHSLHEKGTFNGNVLLAEKGNIIYRKSFGYENMNTRKPLTDESVFELASCSKQFTAMAIALLQQQGKLRYSDPMAKYIPEWDFYKGITIDHLLHHTSGLPDYMMLFDSLWDKSKIANNEDIIRLFRNVKPALDFQPGEKYEYSNTGYAMLASVIERASGMSYAAYLEKNIFRPLKMKHTLVYNRRARPRKVDNYAYGYVYSDNLSRYILPDSVTEEGMRYMLAAYYLDGVAGDGTVNSTAGDLLLWDRALYTEQLLPKKAMETVFTSGKLNNGSEQGYGFGWQLEKDKDIGRIYAHSGGWGGYITYIERHVDQDKTIIILKNTMQGPLGVRSLRLLLYNRPLPVVAQRTEIKLAAEVLDQYTGAYELAPDFILTVSRQGDQLVSQATGQGPLAIYPEKENFFFLKQVDAQLEFVKDGNGKVTKVILYQGGGTHPAPKIQ